MAKPPAGSSLLFGALAVSGQIKQRKNGSYRMVLKGIDNIDWFTDRPFRAEGTLKPQKLLRKWDKYFATSEPNAQAGFRADEEQQMATFEMFKPKIKSGKMIFNVKPLTDSGEDKLTGLQDIELSNISLFIDDATPGMPSCLPNCYKADLRGLDMSGQNLFSTFAQADFSPKGTTKTNLSGAIMPGANLIDANLTGADLTDARLGGAILTGANLSGAGLGRAILTGANLTDANLTATNLNGANLLSVTMNSADLTGANLTGATLNGAYLTGANLTGAVLDDADLNGATLNGATLAGTYLKDANLFGVTLNSVDLTDANLYAADLTSADLNGAIWGNTTCPDGSLNSGTSPCTAEQLNLA